MPITILDGSLVPEGSLLRLTTMRRAWTCLVISVVLAACAEASRDSSADSGITGRTVVDKGGPPLPTGGTSPFVPLAADIMVQRVGSSEVVAEVRSGQDGRF